MYRDDYEQGIEKGTIQGEYNESLEIAKNLLKKEMPDEDIIEIEGITKEDLDKIKNDLKQ